MRSSDRGARGGRELFCRQLRLRAIGSGVAKGKNSSAQTNVEKCSNRGSVSSFPNAQMNTLRSEQ